MKDGVANALFAHRDEIKQTTFGTSLCASIVDSLPYKNTHELTPYSRQSIVNGRKEFKIRKESNIIIESKPYNFYDMISKNDIVYNIEPNNKNKNNNVYDDDINSHNSIDYDVEAELGGIIPYEQNQIDENYIIDIPDITEVDMETNELPRLTLKRKTRNYYDAKTDEERWLHKWLKMNAPVVSGRLNERRIYWTTYANTFIHYRAEALRTNYPVRSILWLKKMMDLFRIKLGKFDRYRCLQCFGHNDPIRTEEFEKHLSLVEKQTYSYKKQKENLNTDELIIVYDFSTIHETALFKIRDLNITVISKNCEKNELEYYYFDYFSENAKDYKYTFMAFYNLFSTEDFIRSKKKIHLWSDGGLKTKENIYYPSILEDDFNLTMDVNFFAPYHGHSICDGHFGNGKKKIRNQIATGVISRREEIYDTFKSLKNTKVQLLDIKDKNIVTSFPEGIRIYFQFTFDGPGIINCRELTDEGEFITQVITETNMSRNNNNGPHGGCSCTSGCTTWRCSCMKNFKGKCVNCKCTNCKNK